MADAGSDPDSMQRTGYEYDPNASTYVKSYDFLSAVAYPDKTSGNPGTNPADKRTFKYNAVGQMKQFTDQNQTVHDYTYDVLGRPLDDKENQRENQRG